MCAPRPVIVCPPRRSSDGGRLSNEKVLNHRNCSDHDYGRFHEGHRAIDDCHAALYLLAQPMRQSKRLAMSSLLENARKAQYQLWARNAPFDLKDVLKNRGYRWNGEARCWSIILDEAALPDEEDYLGREVYGGQQVELRRDKLTARNRFSLAG